MYISMWIGERPSHVLQCKDIPFLWVMEGQGDKSWDVEEVPRCGP